MAVNQHLRGLWAWDPLAKRFFIDAGMAEMYGFGPSSVIGGVSKGDFAARVHLDDREHVRKAFQSAFEKPTDIRFIYKLVRTDGQSLFVEVRGHGHILNSSNSLFFHGFVSPVADPTSSYDNLVEVLKDACRLAENIQNNLMVYLLRTCLSALSKEQHLGQGAD
jgi:PAS domain-containing protein